MSGLARRWGRGCDNVATVWVIYHLYFNVASVTVWTSASLECISMWNCGQPNKGKQCIDIHNQA